MQGDDAGVQVVDVDVAEAGRLHHRLQRRLVGMDADRLGEVAIALGVAGDQAFRFIGDDPLAGGGQLRFTFAGTSTVVQGSTDGDAAPEFEVQLAGRIVLGGDDFLL